MHKSLFAALIIISSFLATTQSDASELKNKRIAHKNYITPMAIPFGFGGFAMAQPYFAERESNCEFRTVQDGETKRQVKICD